MYYSKYYNKMPFPVRFRKTWESGNPAVELQSGNIVEGPAELLSQYNFLAPLPFDFHKIESITQTSEFTFVDEKPVTIETTPPEIFMKAEEVQPSSEESPPITEEPSSIEKTDTKQNEEGVPFDIKTVNWLAVKIEDLEKACAFYKLDITNTQSMNKKDKKWALVKMVKNAAGIL